MGTYYKFICKECNKSGGFLSKQAWGLGNFDIIETFKFLSLHKDHKPYLIVEHEDEYINTPEHSKEEFIKETKGMMPHSNDWKLVNENDWKDVESLWKRKFLDV